MVLNAFNTGDAAFFGALLFLGIVGKVTRTESRALMLGLCSVIYLPEAQSLVIAAVLTLMLTVVEFVRKAG